MLRTSALFEVEGPKPVIVNLIEETTPLSIFILEMQISLLLQEKMKFANMAKFEFANMTIIGIFQHGNLPT